MKRKICPYCGEEIALVAKKCRFCGEWLSEESKMLGEDTPKELLKEQVPNVEVDTGGENMFPCSEIHPPQPPVVSNPTSTVMNNDTLSQGAQQHIVIQPQIVIENKQEVNQEQNVELNLENQEKESPGGCLWSQLVVLSIGLCFVFKGFWYGVASFILLAIAIYIPVLGSALCVILGAAFGVVAGVLASSFGAAAWIGWLIGIVCSAGLIYANLAQRNSEV